MQVVNYVIGFVVTYNSYNIHSPVSIAILSTEATRAEQSADVSVVQSVQKNIGY